MNTCKDVYNCCSCGGIDCGCRYCYDCNKCEVCETLDKKDASVESDYLECDHIKHADRW